MLSDFRIFPSPCQAPRHSAAAHPPTTLYPGSRAENTRAPLLAILVVFWIMKEPVCGNWTGMGEKEGYAVESPVIES